MKPLLILSLATLGLAGLSSCALAPAKIKSSAPQVLRIKPPEITPMHDLLTTALYEAPDSEKGSKALGQFVQRWKKEKMPARADIQSSDNNQRAYSVSIEGDHVPKGENPLDYFDEINATSDFKITRIKHHHRPGIGAPLLALRENKHQYPIEKYYPPEAIAHPLTAVVEAGPIVQGKQSVKIKLVSPLKSETYTLHGKKLPLAGDFSIAWAFMLSKAGKLRQSAILDVLTISPKREPKLFLMEPYDPNKEPLIMIHGLLSTPLAWAKISNELWADEQVRQRYQIWHFLYNTSAPSLYSARLLRAQLRELRSLLDPEGNDAAMRHTTLLTHSMGGLIAKGLVISPGDAFWKAAFKVPQETLKLSPEDRVVLNDAFEWQGDRSIHRIIFICTPHRGSAFADNPIGRVGSWVTKPPTQFQKFFRKISEDNPGVFTPAYEALGTGKLDSVSALSPRQPTIQILSSLPFPSGVKTHSIIGDRGRDGPRSKSSDGIVPYSSSHLEAAESELVVPTGHGAFHHPKAMEEILRILHLP